MPVGSALKPDAFHRAPSFAVNEIPRVGHLFHIRDANGAQKLLIQVPGEVNGMPGRFEWIVDSAGRLTHQLLVKGGAINGLPNVP